MLIKQKKKKHFYSNLFSSIFTKKKWVRRLVFRPLIVTIILAAMALGILFGIHLNKYGHSITLKAWGVSFLHHKLRFIPNYISGLTARPERIEINVAFKDFQKLAYKRQEALRLGTLFSTPDDWVPANITYKGQNYRIDMRLKGDTPDHWLRNDRWSFKIKLKDDKSLFGMKRFAIQDPRTRAFLNEWYLHKLLDFNGLISLRYDFIDVTVNGKPYLIYAIEENFEKLLIENNNRREGPIVKFDTGFYWRQKPGVLSSFQGASIDPYQNKNIKSNLILEKQFKVARNLIELFRQGKLGVSKVFDVEQLARFFAVIDLTGHHHATELDNLKFYYNPVTSLIEPVGYDNAEIMDLGIEGVLGCERKLELDSKIQSEHWYDAVFKDKEFFSHYIKALEVVSQKEYLENFFNKTDKEYKQKLKILHKSYPWYNFAGKRILYNNQAYISDVLNPQKSIHAYYNDFKTGENILSLDICNIYFLPIEIENVLYDNRITLTPVKETVLQAARPGDPLNYTSVEFYVPDNFVPSQLEVPGLQIKFKVFGSSGIFSEAVVPWKPFDSDFLKTDFIRQSPNPRDFDFIMINEPTRTISFKSGTWDLKKSLIVPEGYELIAGEGVVINLSQGAKILSYSPIIMSGSKANPVIVQSKDSTGQGIIVINAGKKSLLEYVKFENLSNPSQGGWELTGAVTFYESPVEILYCEFTQNRSEDSLNTIRSDFSISNTVFKNTYSDAFDADFGKGRISDSAFLNCGNDAIDASGCVIELEKIYIDGAGDKGISIGEKSRSTVNDIDIKNAVIAIASKDLSVLDITNTMISTSKIGCSVYQKKGEFGPASLIAKELTLTQVDIPYLVEMNSILKVNGAQMSSAPEEIDEFKKKYIMK